MRSLTSEIREQQIEWRRNQVLELASQGYNQREICQKLQLDKSAVSRHGPFKTASPGKPPETYPGSCTRKISEMYGRNEAKP